MKINRANIENYFAYRGIESDESWDFANKVKKFGMDDSVSERLNYAVRAWCSAAPGDDSFHAANFVESSIEP